MNTKFMYNGIKHEGKLYKAWYSFGGNIESKTAISIQAKTYDGIPDIGLSIKNNTDVYTDYFEKDRTIVDVNHPQYKSILDAAIKKEVKNLEKYKKRNSGFVTEYVSRTIWNLQSKISEMQNLFNTI